MKEERENEFKKELAALINKYSLENGSDTPDYILADYFLDCLKAYEKASVNIVNWDKITEA